VGIDDAVPRTQSKQVKYLIQHYEVRFVALIYSSRIPAEGSWDLLSGASTQFEPIIHARTSSFKNVRFNLLTKRMRER
jgi:hypothetical protein